MNFGLRENDLVSIRSYYKKISGLDAILLFGSRALGTFHSGSDVDLALKGDINEDDARTLRYELNEESIMPYHFDVVIYSTINNPDLKDHIDTFGKKI